jgi:hypothetical protein
VTISRRLLTIHAGAIGIEVTHHHLFILFIFSDGEVSSVKSNPNHMTGLSASKILGRSYQIERTNSNTVSALCNLMEDYRLLCTTLSKAVQRGFLCLLIEVILFRLQENGKKKLTWVLTFPRSRGTIQDRLMHLAQHPWLSAMKMPVPKPFTVFH